MSFKDKIVALKEKEKQVIERAYAQTPVEYHGYILLLEQNLKVSNAALEINDELKSMGVYANNGKTYLSQQVPYMTVDGRIAMAVDEALKKGTQIEIGAPEFHEVNQKLICNVTVKTARGIATGTAKVGIGGGGVDLSNPFENAQTSAIGRALGFQGYGLIGTGVASAEEVAFELKEQSNALTPNSEKQPKQDKNKKNSSSSSNSKTNNQPPKDEKNNKKSDPKKDPSKNNKAAGPLQPLGTYSFALKNAKLEPVGDKQFWVIAAERVGTNKTSSIYVDPKIDFPALNASEGEVLEISIAQSGSVFMATDIRIPDNRLGA
jgi:hypothetical protein